MEELLKIAKPDFPKLSKIIRNIAGTHLSNLSEPCYMPDHKVYYHEFLNALNLTDQDVKQWIKYFWKGMPQAKAGIQTRTTPMLLAFLMWLFLKEKNQLSYESTMIFFTEVMYTNAMLGSFPEFCNIDVFRYTLDHLAKTHLFVREKTISGAIFHLSKEMIKKHTETIRNVDKLRISMFMQELRTRINQSVWSFAEQYYKNSEEGKRYTTPWQSEEGEGVVAPTVENVERIASEISSRITVYGEINPSNLGIAQKLTRISGVFANEIVKQVSIPEHKEDVKLVIELFLRELKNVKQICGKEFFGLVTSLLSIKRTSKQVYFKKEVTSLLLKVLRQNKQEKKFLGLTRQTQFGTITFLSLYIMLFARQTLCPESKK
jgi:hypothetical protein